MVGTKNNDLLLKLLGIQYAVVIKIKKIRRYFLKFCKIWMTTAGTSESE